MIRRAYCALAFAFLLRAPAAAAAAAGHSAVLASSDVSAVRPVHAVDPSQVFPDSVIVTRPRFSDEIVGSGPDIVFIPGWTSSRATWRSVAEGLRSHYRVHLIQLAGFAGEPARANASGPVLVPAAEAILAYLVEQHLTPATIIGHSLGGTMVLYFAERHPSDIKKGMIVDAWPFYANAKHGPTATVASAKPFADETRTRTRQAMDSGTTQALTQMTVSQTNREMIRAWGEASDLAASNNALADDLMLDLRPDLSRIAVPLTLIYPDYGPAGVPPDVAPQLYRELYAAVPHMRFVEITGSLHFVMLDQPTQFSAALDAFLKN